MKAAWKEVGWRASVVGQDKGSVTLRYWADRIRLDLRPSLTTSPAIARTLRNVACVTQCNAEGAAPRGARRKAVGPGGERLARLAGVAVVAFVTLAVPAALGRFLGLRITLTDSSAPTGIYREVTGVTAGRGALVAACLPAAIARTGLARRYLGGGDCPAGAEPIAKVIGALPGDVVEIEPGWVAVNGARFPDSRTAARDSAGRPLGHLPWGARRVAPGQVWLFGFNDMRSWDARYFGPVPAGSIGGVLKPVLTW